MTLRSRLVDGMFGALELVASLHDWVMRLRKPELKPIPLSRPVPQERRGASGSGTFPQRSSQSRNSRS